jgi:predicted 2-oxoglutarate/Fe(II)-dependent dioxygenase YbiX
LILEFPNYLDSETTKQIREAIKPFVSSKKETVYNRDGNTVNITGVPELKDLDNKLYEIFTKVQKTIIQNRYKPLLSSADSGYEYHLYNPNDICHYHSDGEIGGFKDTNNKTLLRYASVILHLNTVYDGGELIFPEQNKSIKTEEGKLVIFPPYGMYGHYTTPSNEPREVIVTWFVYDGINVVKTNP